MNRLTRREIEVCGYLCRGFSNEEISIKLGISKRTAEDHRHHIFKKFRVRNAVQLVREVYHLPDEVVI